MTEFEKEVLARLAEIEKRLDPSTLAQAIMDAKLPNVVLDPGIVRRSLSAEEMARDTVVIGTDEDT